MEGERARITLSIDTTYDSFFKKSRAQEIASGCSVNYTHHQSKDTQISNRVLPGNQVLLFVWIPLFDEYLYSHPYGVALRSVNIDIHWAVIKFTQRATISG